MQISKKKLALLDRSKLPRHVAMIPDGNRRWAKENFYRLRDGYLKGIEAIEDICEISLELSIEVLTFYAFSTENQERTESEKNMLMSVLEQYLAQDCSKLLSSNIQLRAIGNVKKLPNKIQTTLFELIERSKKNSKMTLVLALNYGGRDELLRAFHRIQNEAWENHKKTLITEELVSSHLDTAGIVDPDLVIRTSGECRFSNFLLWQSFYSEFYIAKQYWPDFTPDCFIEALLQFQKRTRRLGR